MNIFMQRNGQDHTMQLSQHLGGVICVKVKTKKDTLMTFEMKLLE